MGDSLDLEDLSRSLSSPSLRLVHSNGMFAIESDQFAQDAEPVYIRQLAETLVERIDGAARVLFRSSEPIRFYGLVRIADDGTRTNYAFETGGATARARVTSMVVGEDGVEREITHSWPIGNWLSVAARDEVVARVLTLYRESPLTWSSLYRIFEIIRADCGGQHKLERLEWVPASTSRLFMQTANHPAAIGNAARHGVNNEQPPLNPMHLSEAQSFIQMITFKWLQAKQ